MEQQQEISRTFVRRERRIEITLIRYLSMRRDQSKDFLIIEIEEQAEGTPFR